MQAENVYQKAMGRIEYIFSRFDNICVSFSGGKDSGVMLNLVLDYMRSHKIKRKIAVLHIDVEASYRRTMDFVEKIYLDNLDLIDPYWICLPMITTNAVSMYEPYWIFWDRDKKEKWVRPMPDHPFIIHQGNCPFGFYHLNMTFEEFVSYFGDWLNGYRKAEKTACLVGIRSNESLNRYRAVSRKDKAMFEDKEYSTRISENTYNFYPVYDWKVDDIWIYNGKFDKPYNTIYDLFYKAGISLSKMRICEPYGDEQKAGLNLFKVLEPETWIRLVDRVSGANFGNIYCGTKALGVRQISLPEGHTWRKYCKFLLDSLPEETRNIYTAKFLRFIRYWNKTGCPVADGDIQRLNPDTIINTYEFSRRGKSDKYVVKFRIIPDALPGLDNKTDFLSWKRMCMAILKNDITCHTLSFSMTKRQILHQQQLLEKYKNML
ncbi:MAG: DUF3440 domain-containing protein [Prevotella sp.]|jgi:predicted phosphoadenosine phosphosulfate sulfurtransferase|nr:DUF3440 domain-containing protein [Prevotella sp.]